MRGGGRYRKEQAGLGQGWGAEDQKQLWEVRPGSRAGRAAVGLLAAVGQPPVSLGSPAAAEFLGTGARGCPLSEHLHDLLILGA